MKAPGSLGELLRGFELAFAAVAALSGLLNVLTLAGSFFMLLVYDRVLPSHSLPTLAGLLVLVSVVYFFQAMLEFVRSSILVEIGAAMDARIARDVFEAGSLARLRSRTGEPLQPIRDLDIVRGFVSGPGPMALFDCPWIFLYLGICFLFHWLIGVVALCGALILIALTVLTDRLTQKSNETATVLAGRRLMFASSSSLNAETVHAMGMSGRMRLIWVSLNAEYTGGQRSAARLAGALNSFTRVFRMFLQSSVLAMGAYLVLEQKATGGIIIASSILTSRALAPIELAIANWKGFVGARQAWRRVTALLAKHPAPEPATPLPAPSQSLVFEGVSVAPPGTGAFTVMEASFGLRAGAGLGIIGPSGGGKSSLVRAMVGAWPVQRGVVRIDGASMAQWESDRLGCHVGYLPQSVDLLTGTVAQNIGRFDPDVTAEDVIAAAKSANVHELILRLPKGYETPVGPNGVDLSAGQRQRIALARALLRDPFLLVLDEPNSNLDTEGEAALVQAIAAARRRGAIVVLVTHRASVLEPIDHLLVMSEGRVQMVGPKAEVLAKMQNPPNVPSPAAAKSPSRMSSGTGTIIGISQERGK